MRPELLDRVLLIDSFRSSRSTYQVAQYPSAFTPALAPHGGSPTAKTRSDACLVLRITRITSVRRTPEEPHPVPERVLGRGGSERIAGTYRLRVSSPSRSLRSALRTTADSTGETFSITNRTASSAPE
jgi:hypothetical protein